jgi:hypothetical protein
MSVFSSSNASMSRIFVLFLQCSSTVVCLV